MSSIEEGGIEGENEENYNDEEDLHDPYINDRDKDENSHIPNGPAPQPSTTTNKKNKLGQQQSGENKKSKTADSSEADGESKEEQRGNPDLYLDPEAKFKELWTNGLTIRRKKEEQLAKIYNQIKGNLDVSNNAQDRIEKLALGIDLDSNDILKKYLRDNKDNTDLLAALNTNSDFKEQVEKQGKSYEEAVIDNAVPRSIVSSRIIKELDDFKTTFNKLIESPLATCLLDFIALYEDMLLTSHQKTETRKINKNALTIYYFADLPATIEENDKDTQENMILNRFFMGGYYIRRVLTMLRHNYFDKNKVYAHFQDMIFDLEMRSILLDSLRLLINDNNRKKRSHHRSLVDLKSLMFRLNENYVNASKKILQDDSKLLTPQLNLIDPINFAKIPNEIVHDLDSIYTTTITMLFDSTLIENSLSSRQTYRTYGIVKEEENDDRILAKAGAGVTARRRTTNTSSSAKKEYLAPVKYLPVEKTVYVVTCVNQIKESQSVSIGGTYKPLLSILYMTNSEIYKVVNRIMSRVLAHVRLHHQPKVIVEINDAIHLIISDEYARAVLCELCGVDQFEVLGQSLDYHTKFQLQMAVRLAEQHVEYLSFFLDQAYSRL